MSVRINLKGKEKNDGTTGLDKKKKSKYGEGHSQALSTRLLGDDDYDHDNNNDSRDSLAKNEPRLNIEDIENPYSGPTLN